MLRRSFSLTLFFVPVCLGVASAEDQQLLRKLFVGRTPPEIVGETRNWLGESPPATLASLRGKVVWLQFNF